MARDLRSQLLIQDYLKVGPFLRWAGGKRWLLPHIKNMIPEFSRYFEPFVGSGALFFYLYHQNKGKQYFISDINEGLINMYQQLKQNYRKVIRYLKDFKNTRKDYYKIRSHVVNDPIYDAARLMYLNKTCFNGLYRVNKRGIFNVPYGRHPRSELFNEKQLYKVSKILREVNIEISDFESALLDVKKGDFIFLDPPYTVAHRNNGFIEYNEKIFSWEDQQRLANRVRLIALKGARFILTNAAHERIRDLYDGVGTRVEIERVSTISGDIKNRRKINEYIYTNCI